MAKHKKSKKKAKKIVAKGIQIHPFWKNTRLHVIIIAALSVLLYCNTIGHDFTQDDAIAISENMHTMKGSDGIKDLLQKDAFHGFFKTDKNLLPGGRYRPLTFIQFAFGIDLVGGDLDKMKTLGHLMNILWYTLTCLLLYFVIAKLLAIEKFPHYAKGLAFITAILFTAHPIHTEAVANIKGRDEIMAMFFSLASLYFILKYVVEDKKSILFLILGGFSFFLGILSKENALTYLGVIPIALWVFTKAKQKDYIYVFGALLSFLLIYFEIRRELIGFGSAGESTELMNNPFLKFENGSYVDFTAGEKFATMLFCLSWYFKLLFIPHPLTHDYYPRHVEIMDFGNPTVLLAFVLYSGLLAYGLWGTWKKKTLGFAVLYYLMTIFIVSNLLVFVGTNISERFLFMPSLGFSLAVAIVIYQFFFKGKNVIKVMPVIGILAFVVALYSLKTVDRNFDWVDNYTLFTTDVEVSKRSAKLQNACAGAKTDKAFSLQSGALQTQLLSEAKTHAETAIQIHPYYKNAHLLLGNAYFGLGDYEKANISYENCLRIDPGFQDAINNRERLLSAQSGSAEIKALEDKGLAAAQSKDHQTAIYYFNQILEKNPNNPKICYFIAISYSLINDNATAKTYLERAYANAPEGDDKAKIKQFLDQLIANGY